MGRSVIIIGAGIAGLSAGCYGQMNNYRTQIFEMGDQPGGVCTSWKRKGYTIDGCIHWLVGSRPGSNFYTIWEQLGVVQGRKMIDHDQFARVEDKDGKAFTVYTDIKRLEQHMLELAPKDKDVISDFIKGINDCAKIDMPIDKAPELYGPMDGIKMMPLLKPLLKWGKLSSRDFANRFKDPFVREAFNVAFFGEVPDFPLFFILMTMVWLSQKVASYPLGGSLEFSRAIEKRYLGLEGEIHYKSPVEKILVKDDKAVGVRLADGTEHYSDIVISAADGHTTIFDMLDGNYINDEIRGYYDKLTLFTPLVHVALGVDRKFDELPHSVTGINYPLDEPVTIGEKERKRLGVYFYNFDPSLAPAGKTVVKVMLDSDYEYWKILRQDLKRYEAEKEQIADKVVSLLDKRFPGLAAKVEMSDVATPITWERFTGNWRASFEGWLPTTKTFSMRMSKTLPGLDNFYMVGQWVEPGGGVPAVAMSGRNVFQIICHKDKRPFGTTTP